MGNHEKCFGEENSLVGTAFLNDSGSAVSGGSEMGESGEETIEMT